MQYLTSCPGLGVYPSKARGKEDSQNPFHQFAPLEEDGERVSLRQAPRVAMVQTSPFQTASGLCRKVGIPDAAPRTIGVLEVIARVIRGAIQSLLFPRVYDPLHSFHYSYAALPHLPIVQHRL